VATGAPAELRAQIGDQRVDVVASDVDGFERLVAALGATFSLTLAPERRTISVPAPREALDLASVTNLIVSTGAAIDEVALRRPTLDDAFLALTGTPAQSVDEQEEVPA
jgi:ABC-2 type transport system ATP-binding protein